MEANKISVIVPVYNAEKYLEKCVESIINQTYKNLEIILIDDGSTDNSLAVCKKMEKKDTRIRVVVQENSGVAVTRNRGIQEATGEYIGFVDSDDYIDEDMYESLYRTIEETKTEYAICGIYHVYTNRTEEPKERLKKVISREEAVFMMLESRHISVNPVNRLLAKRLYEGIHFPDGMISEDAYVALDILEKTDKVALDLTPKYYYFHRNESITTSSYKPLDQCVIKAYEKNQKIVLEKYPKLKEVAEFRLCWAYFYVLDKMLLSATPVDKKEKKKIVHFLRKHTGKILKNQYVGKGRKIATVALFMHVSLYKIFLLKYRKDRKRN